VGIGLKAASGVVYLVDCSVSENLPAGAQTQDLKVRVYEPNHDVKTGTTQAQNGHVLVPYAPAVSGWHTINVELENSPARYTLSILSCKVTAAP
jgi:hypothetical protein